MKKEQTKITLEKLKNFLRESKKKTYASIFSIPKKIEGMGKRYIIKKGDLTYLDSYHGEKIFSGKEVVLFKDCVIWSMVYFGGIKEDIKDEKIIYKFLKFCLKKVPIEFPIRGPKEFSKGDFKYVNRWNGNFYYFYGKEEIFNQEKLVYTLNYFGGKISF